MPKAARRDLLVAISAAALLAAFAYAVSVSAAHHSESERLAACVRSEGVPMSAASVSQAIKADESAGQSWRSAYHFEAAIYGCPTHDAR